ncbi:MAG: hypothetical protein JWN52_7313 [Actinomycetia bacterium]|nr:hypothetical protein [Actinomycetes bacterium]
MRGLRRARLCAWLRAAFSAAVVIGLFFMVPVHPTDLQGRELVVRAALLLLGIAVLSVLVTFQVRRTLRRQRLFAEQISMLLTVVNVVIVFFSLIYYRLADHFNGVHSRLDALYFSVVTLCTVGFGDITPVSQTARAIVIVQMLFDLIIVTSAISIIVGSVRERQPSDAKRPEGGAPPAS